MSLAWRGQGDLARRRPGPAGLARAAARGVPLVLLLAGGLGLMAGVRLLERPLCHPRRPWTPAIAVGVCRGALRLLGLRLRQDGRRVVGPGALVANHASWLDILVLNAGGRVVFVSKAEVAGWPGIGLLARATGTLFVRREARGEAPRQAAAVAERLARGERVVLFPEGTSTDGRRVLPFKPALFAGLLAPGLPPDLAVQPVTLAWEAPPGEDPRFYGWWGGSAFGPSALAILAVPRQGSVRVVHHAPIPVASLPDRKALARAAEAAVRAGLGAAGIRPSPEPGS